MANATETPVQKFSARMKRILLSRVKNANAKGKYFVLTEGYYKSWKVLAKQLETDGKLFISNGKIRLIDVDIDAIRTELKASASAPKVKKTRKAKVTAPVAQETAPAVAPAVETTPEVAPVVPTSAPAVETPAVETQASVAQAA